jgi:hypothetical protein
MVTIHWSMGNGMRLIAESQELDRRTKRMVEVKMSQNGHVSSFLHLFCKSPIKGEHGWVFLRQVISVSDE